MPVNQYTNLIGKTERHTFHAHFDYDITNSINFSVDGEYGKVKTDNTSGAFQSHFIPILFDNAYVVSNPAIAANFPGFALMSKDWSSQLNSHSTFDTTVWSVVGDLSGGIGDTSWTWDAYVTHGHTKRVQTVFDNPHLNSLNYALDAVIDPGTGDPICRATLLGSTDPLAQGCVPINPFGTQPLTQAQHDYGFGYLQENELVNQTVAAVNTTGNLFEGFGAGPIGLALGAEYRWEDINNLNMSGAPKTDYFIQYGNSFKGKVNVWETYGEVNVPILKDVPFARNLEFDGAVRYSHYHNVGEGPSFVTANNGLTTWKLSGIWDVTNWFRFRGSQSRDARAGNFRELYYGQLLHAGGLFGYCGGGQNDPCDIHLQGNPAVKPETSDTSTVGVVLTPGGFLDGFQFAADYYDIKLKNGITPAGGQLQDMLALCRQMGGMTCTTSLGTAIFNDAALQDVQSVTEYSYNARSYKVKGIDFSANYSHEFANADSVNIRVIATKTISQFVETAIGSPARNIVGETGTANGFLPDFQSSPNWVGNLTVTYNHGGFTGTVQGRYLSSGTYDFYGVGPGDVNYQPDLSYTYSNNKIPFYQLYNLTLSYTFQDLVGDNSSMQLFVTVNNLFDRQPPMTGSAVYYDRLGRRFRFGIRAAF